MNDSGDADYACHAGDVLACWLNMKTENMFQEEALSHKIQKLIHHALSNHRIGRHRETLNFANNDSKNLYYTYASMVLLSLLNLYYTVGRTTC